MSPKNNTQGANITIEPLQGEWTTIEVNGRKYTVLCQPDPEPTDTQWNDLQTYIGISEYLKSKLLVSPKEDFYSQRAIQSWISKFPKPIK